MHSRKSIGKAGWMNTFSCPVDKLGGENSVAGVFRDILSKELMEMRGEGGDLVFRSKYQRI